MFRKQIQEKKEEVFLQDRDFLILSIEDIFIFKEKNEINPWTENDKDLIKKAFKFVEELYKKDKRRSGEPYLNHCIFTAINITKQNMDAESVVAGLLHDVIEDEKTNPEIIKKLFGEDVLFLIEGVTKLKKIKYQGIERHVESMRKFFIAIAEDIRVVVIKLCDRLHNVSTLEYVREDKRKRIALETLEIHARLADRIGMGKLKTQLEDKSFPYAYPEDYKKVKEMFIGARSSSKEYLWKVLLKVEEELNIANITVINIDHRFKHLYSLYEKLKKNNWDIQKIYDIAAMRIIVCDVATCYQVLGIIHNIFKPVSGRFKDYIALPKPNGYKSLHTTVFNGEGGTTEIQIRTEKMHAEAEYGIASHLFYKELPNLRKEKTKNNIAWTKDLLNIQASIKDNAKLFENLKREFFDKKIFVHTPKGDVLEFPNGAGVIDFAYAIHSELGNHISGGMINGKLINLNTRLKNGDIVEIIQKENAKPSRKWIDYTFTAHAKRHIKNYLKENGSVLDRFFSNKIID